MPLLGTSYYTVNADFQTAQAITPGQGQAVTIAGVKVGIISGVEPPERRGRSIDEHRQALQPDLPRRHDAAAAEVPAEGHDGRGEQGHAGPPARCPTAARCRSPRRRPTCNLDELLASLDADTRSYLQELIGSAGPALDGRGIELSAALRRFDPTTRDFELIARALVSRQQNLSRVIHNLAILAAAIGTRDASCANLVRASNAVFGTFAQENANVSATVAKLPGALGEITARSAS